MQKQEFHLRLRDYSLAAGAMLLASSQAKSQIVYHHYTSPLWASDDYLDINNDGLYDLYFDSHIYQNDNGGYDYSYEIYSWNASVSISAMDNFAIAVTPGELKKITPGQIINSSLSWCQCDELLAHESVDYSPYFHEYGGYWFEEVKGLFAFRIKDGVDKYYGWMRMSVYPGHASIFDYAYNSVPNQPILAGETDCDWLNSSVEAIPAATVCNGDTVTLQAIPSSGYSYSWKKIGTTLYGATNSQYKIAAGSGDFYVIVSVPNSCYDTSEIVHVSHVNPELATVYFYNDTLFSTLLNVDQWYFNSEPIPGATAYYHVPQLPGNYSVETHEGACYAMSLPYYVFTSGTPGITYPLFPNIRLEDLMLVIELSPMEHRRRSFSIIDMFGRQLQQLTSEETTLKIPIQALPTGEYILMIQDEGNLASFKFGKN